MCVLFSVIDNEPLCIDSLDFPNFMFLTARSNAERRKGTNTAKTHTPDTNTFEAVGYKHFTYSSGTTEQHTYILLHLLMAR